MNVARVDIWSIKSTHKKGFEAVALLPLEDTQPTFQKACHLCCCCVSSAWHTAHHHMVQPCKMQININD